METAADLRAAGASWDTVAMQVGRQPAMLQRWARLYAGVWEQMLREAEERISRQASNESRSVMRSLLRHKNSKTRLAAADKLAKRRLEEKAAEREADPHANQSAIVACMEQVTQADLERYIDEFVKRRAERTPPVLPDGSASETTTRHQCRA
jgi:alanyl-tRNA synthetase